MHQQYQHYYFLYRRIGGAVVVRIILHILNTIQFYQQYDGGFLLHHAYVISIVHHIANNTVYIS